MNSKKTNDFSSSFLNCQIQHPTFLLFITLVIQRIPLPNERQFGFWKKSLDIRPFWVLETRWIFCWKRKTRPKNGSEKTPCDLGFSKVMPFGTISTKHFRWTWKYVLWFFWTSSRRVLVRYILFLKNIQIQVSKSLFLSSYSYFLHTKKLHPKAFSLETIVHVHFPTLFLQ